MPDPNQPNEADDEQSELGADMATDYDPPLDTPLGEPFAIAHDADLLERDDAAGVPGTYASIQCECGEPFRANLLDGRIKKCPGCKQAYTHVLLWARVDDHDIADEFFDTLTSSDDDDDDDEQAPEAEPETPRRRTIRDADE